MQQKKDLFLCHSSRDKDKVVIPFIKILQQKSISYWLDEAEILPGDSIIDKINEGLKTSRFVATFISRSFLKRNWPQQELKSALAGSIHSRKNNVIPVLVNVSYKTFFKKYPLLRDKKCASIKSGLEELAKIFKKILYREKIPSIPHSFSPTLLSLEKISELLNRGKINPNKWLRLPEQSNLQDFIFRKGFDELIEELSNIDIRVQINWDKAPSREKYYLAGVLLSMLIAFKPKNVEGLNKSFKRESGVFIHCFDRPAYPKKYYKDFALKAASGCKLDDEWWILMNVPAFFDAGWRDELSMAPIVLGKINKSFLDFNEESKLKFNPWIPYDIDPKLVLVPCIGISKKLRKRLRRFKYGGRFPRVAMNPEKFTISEARFLRNNGFMIIDQISKKDDAIDILHCILKNINID